MKDYKKYTNLRNVENLVSKLNDLDCEVMIVEGGLNDTYLINTELLQGRYKMGRIKFRKYMILGHEFASEYHNHLYMQLTDNEQVFNDWLEEYYKQMEEYEREEAGSVLDPAYDPM